MICDVCGKAMQRLIYEVQPVELRRVRVYGWTLDAPIFVGTMVVPGEHVLPWVRETWRCLNGHQMTHEHPRDPAGQGG